MLRRISKYKQDNTSKQVQMQTLLAENINSRRNVSKKKLRNQRSIIQETLERGVGAREKLSIILKKMDQSIIHVKCQRIRSMNLTEAKTRMLTSKDNKERRNKFFCRSLMEEKGQNDASKASYELLIHYGSYEPLHTTNSWYILKKLFEILKFPKKEEASSPTTIKTSVSRSHRNVTYYKESIKSTCSR